MSGGIVRVAAAVILRDDGQVLLAQRPPGKVYAGYWEFPGGKLEPGESPRDALDRELREELGLCVRRAAPWLVQRYVYPHAHVELHFFRVFAVDGEPVAHDGQDFAWQTPGQLTVAPLLPANARIIRALLLPPFYGITMAADLGVAQSLASAEIALDRGLAMIQLREKHWTEARQRGFAESMATLASRYGARVLLNGDAENARAWGCAGVHWTAAALTAASTRPADMLCAASCHTRSDLDKASALDLDFVVLGPVLPTATHPGMRVLRWEQFAAIADAPQLPIYALGGLGADDLDTAIGFGAHGVALRRAAWDATAYSSFRRR